MNSTSAAETSTHAVFPLSISMGRHLDRPRFLDRDPNVSTLLTLSGDCRHPGRVISVRTGCAGSAAEHSGGMGTCSTCRSQLLEVPMTVGESPVVIVRCSHCDTHHWERD